jgi:Zn-dependent protease with chaperone function
MKNSTSDNQHHAMASMKYSTFAFMIMVGTFIMFGLMYFNTFSLDHLFFSETRSYMALMMGAVMAMVMLIFMWKMYPNKKLNAVVLIASSVVFCVSLWLVRSQATVEDVAYMRAMIPHHSIAILTSERANINDPRVRKLADGIIEAQRKEIVEMKNLIQDLETE